MLAAGVDCIGFAQRVFDYPKNPYIWISLGNGAGRAYPMMEDDADARGQTTYSELIVGSGSSALEKIRNLSYIKPGDILYYLETGGVDGAHIAVVQRVDRDANGAVAADGIHLIESRFFGSTSYITRPRVEGRTLVDVENLTWRVVRLITNGDQ